MRTPTRLTKQRRVLGVPVSRRSTDWRKVGLLGVGVASTVAGGVGALASRVRNNGSDEGESKSK